MNSAWLHLKPNAHDWSRWAVAAPAEVEVPFAAAFAHVQGESQAGVAGQKPSWLSRLVDALGPAVTTAEPAVAPHRVGGDRKRNRPPVGAGWTPTDTTALVCIGEEAWLLSLQGVGTDRLKVGL